MVPTRSPATATSGRQPSTQAVLIGLIDRVHLPPELGDEPPPEKGMVMYFPTYFHQPLVLPVILSHHCNTVIHLGICDLKTPINLSAKWALHHRVQLYAIITQILCCLDNIVNKLFHMNWCYLCQTKVYSRHFQMWTALWSDAYMSFRPNLLYITISL